MKSLVLRWLLRLLAALIVLSLAWGWLTLHWSYSEGERAGYIQKLSKKGWLCKTWEGEIAMATMPGAIPEKFEFTVRNDETADKINQLAGKRVVLNYRQHKFIPTSCFGETEYFVDAAREVSDATSTGVAPPMPAVTAPVPASAASQAPPPPAR